MPARSSPLFRPMHSTSAAMLGLFTSTFDYLNNNSHRRARQCCFWLLAFISLPQVRNIHLPGRMILPESLIPSDKYFLKNLTFVVRNSLVWLRHHSSQTLYVARVKSKQLKSSVLPGLPDGKSRSAVRPFWLSRSTVRFTGVLCTVGDGVLL